MEVKLWQDKLIRLRDWKELMDQEILYPRVRGGPYDEGFLTFALEEI